MNHVNNIQFPILQWYYETPLQPMVIQLFCSMIQRWLVKFTMFELTQVTTDLPMAHITWVCLGMGWYGFIQAL